MNSLIKLMALLYAICLSTMTWAAADIEINTPGITALTQSMQNRYTQLAPHLSSGAVGLTADGLIAVHDAGAIPLAERQAVNALVTAENNDRKNLYQEIARANGHPEWAVDIRSTFAQRWIQRAQTGWWIQSAKGWQQK
jgi:hypothetical protein